MVSKNIQFNVEWCNSADENERFKGKTCKEPGPIKDYIYDMQVETWVVHKKMNFSDKLGEPSFLVMDILDSQMMHME